MISTVTVVLLVIFRCFCIFVKRWLVVSVMIFHLDCEYKYFAFEDEVLRMRRRSTTYFLRTSFVREDEVLRMRRRSTLYSKYFAVYFVRRSTSSTKTEYFVFEDEALYSRSTSKYFIEKWPCNRTPVDSSHNSYISTHSPFNFFLSALFWTNNRIINHRIKPTSLHFETVPGNA